MRSMMLPALVILAGLPMAAQAQPATTKPAPVTAPAPARAGYPPPVRTGPCCVRKVWDARGLELGDVLDYQLAPAQPWGAAVAYRIKGGDAVVLLVNPEMLSGYQSPGGSNALFTTPDCSGNAMFAMLSTPPLAKRYAMVLMAGWPPGPGTTSAWLWVSDPTPTRGFPPAGTVFHSQWDNNQCQPYPAPGYTINVASGYGGYPMHRVEDLLAKYHRPFYINY
ncbi:MAG TPA: hypothetical protein VGC72_18175 [Candidatus Elarobacter sp.]|jgi:hypothetical protein